MSTNAIRTRDRVLLIELKSLTTNPHQPRKSFDERELHSLAQSIRENGILQPLTVRRLSDGTWQLIAGERRMRAAIIAGLVSVPCIEVAVDDERSAVLELLENLQRSDLSFFEQAEAIAKLIERLGVTQEEIAARLGKSQAAIANKLRLLKLPQDIRTRITEMKLSERHARALLATNKDSLNEVVNYIIAKQLNVSQTERYIKALNDGKQSYKHNVTPLVKDVRLFVNTINHAVEIMKQSGIDAETERKDNELFIEYRIRIPKTSAHGRYA